MASDVRYHVKFEDEASGENLGLMLTTGGGQLGFTSHLINPYAAKAGQGDTKDHDLTEWSIVTQRDWTGGRGQEEFGEEPTAFLDAYNLETRIQKQITLGPLVQDPVNTTLPSYEPGAVAWYRTEYWGDEVCDEGEGVGHTLYSGKQLAQKFQRYYLRTVHLESVLLSMKNPDGISDDVTVGIHLDDGGAPADSPLVSKTLSASGIGTTFEDVTFEFATPLALTASVDYWIVVTCACSSSTPLYWDMSMKHPYRAMNYYAATKEGSLWVPDRQTDFMFKLRFANIARSMSFTAPTGGLSCSSVQLYAVVYNPPATVNVKLCQDSGGVPGTVLATKAMTSWVWGWNAVNWDSPVALSSETVYHIVLEQPSRHDEPPNYDRYLAWGGCSSGGYATGGSCEKVGSGSWAAQTEDLYFRVNVSELEGPATRFVRYNGKWYVAAGDTVYEWNSGSSSWTVSEQRTGYDVTDMENWGGYLWAARGADDTLRRYNGTSWASVASTAATYLKAGGGYLHRTGGAAGDTHKVYYTANGTDWSDAIEIGAGDFPVTAMEWYRDMLVCATATHLWGIAAELGYPLLNWRSQEDADNGKGMLAWSRTNCLYIPLLHGLYRWNGDSMVAVGPEQGMGLPHDRAGRVAQLVGTCNWLFACIDASTTGYSTIMAYNGMSGWHEIARSEKTNQRIRAAGYETLSSPPRLWFGLDKGTRYVKLPDYSDNPYQWSGYEFNAAGELITSWFGSDLLEVVKDLHSVIIRGEGFSSAQTVEVFYEVDRSGYWTFLGQITAGTRAELEFEPSYFSTKTIGTGSTVTTIELASGYTSTDMSVGQWVKINNEVRQIASITDSDTIVLETALSSAPAAGDYVYCSRPAGREFRLKLALYTTDDSATPKVTALIVRYQNNVLDRFVYRLNIRVEDRVEDLTGGPYPHTAADLRTLLATWARRHTPFTLYDPDGNPHTVKVTSMAEGGVFQEDGPETPRYKSTVSMNLVEVA